MKKILIILLSLCTLAVARDKQTVAVYMEGNEPTDAPGAFDILEGELVKAISGSGKYSAINRTSDILNLLTEEHIYTRGGAVDDEQIKDIGKQFGVQYLCIVKVRDVKGGSFYLDVRLVDVVTAETIKSATRNSYLNNPSDMMHIAKLIAQELLYGKAEAEPEVKPTPPEEESKHVVPEQKYSGNNDTIKSDYHWKFSFGGGVIFLSRWDDADFNADFKFKNLLYITTGYDILLSFLFPVGEKEYLMIGPEAVFSSMFDRYGNTPVAFNVPVKLRYTPGGDSEDGWFLDVGTLAGAVWLPSIPSEKKYDSVFDYGVFIGVGRNSDDFIGIHLRSQLTNTHWALKLYFEF